MISAPATNDSTTHLPRILCLHGGGTNARIFRAQCRGLVAQLKSEYRLVFAQAPFASQAGSDVLSVYSQWGPFRRWLRWRPEDPTIRAEDAVKELDQWLAAAIRQDDMMGATGEWVALLGFSQGAKVSASLLYRQQVREELFGKDQAGPNFRFGVLFAGRAPLISLDPDLKLSPALPDASQITDIKDSGRQVFLHKGHMLRIPTLHVHGLRDDGRDLHRQLLEHYCDRYTRRLVEWDGDHRLPLKFKDVALVVRQIRELARETGIY
ncbi:hypothetical protein MMC34_005959 [Xylographa carneopallida]|nr:hypothetical protein [Xylographa carneopallida]